MEKNHANTGLELQLIFTSNIRIKKWDFFYFVHGMDVGNRWAGLNMISWEFHMQQSM